MPWWPGRRRARAASAAILVPSLYSGDAVGNDATAMRDVLSALGCDARLFAETSEPTLGAGGVDAARSFLLGREAMVILHHSTRWDIGLQLFSMARGPQVIRDHNITPEFFFAGLNDEFRTASALGAEQRAHYARAESTRLYLAASPANARELIHLGADPEHVHVVPPFHRVDELVATPPDEATLRRFSTAAPTALFVGRIAPNKGHRRLLRIAATYRELFASPLQLRFVGPCDPRLSRLLALLDSDARALSLDGAVEYLGFQSLAQLKASYLTAHVFLCCSEHEGFCVPLCEAACLGLPIVAAGSAAVGETLGPTALYLGDAPDDVVACAVHRVIADADLRQSLVASQQRRFTEAYSRAAIEAAFRAAIAPLLAGTSAASVVSGG